MKPLYTLLLLFAFALISCDDEKTIFVDNQFAQCDGVTEQQCLRIKENENDTWSIISNKIEGFTFEPGYNYKLKVKISKPKDLPADASLLTYKLIEVVSKEKAAVVLKKIMNSIYNTWIVNTITDFDNKTNVSPSFTIKKENISGESGCNGFGGPIKVTTKGMFDPGMLMKTEMYCEKTMPLENAFFKALAQAKLYKINNNSLIVLDKEKEILFTAFLNEKTKNDLTPYVRYSITSRGHSKAIEVKGNNLFIDKIRPTLSKTNTLLNKSDAEAIKKLIAEIDVTTLEKIQPPSTKHQFDGAEGAVFSITIGDKTYYAPTFDHGNPPAKLKELVEKLNTLK